MNEKYILLLFLIILSSSYYVSINNLTKEYYKINNMKINKKNITTNEKIIKYEYFTINLENNITCYFGTKNIKIIKNNIRQIEKNEKKYYTNLYFNEKTNKKNYYCSKPKIIIDIYLDYLMMNLEIIICSCIFTFIIINILQN